MSKQINKPSNKIAKPKSLKKPKMSTFNANDAIAAANKVINESKDGFVKVVCGTAEEDFAVVGTTVEALRSSPVATALNIPESAEVYVDGEPVKGDYVLMAGQQIEFIQRMGTKGNDFHVSLEGNELVIRAPLKDKPVLSSTGKNFVVASSCGNQTTTVEYLGQKIVVGFNAYYKNKLQ